MTQKSYPWPGVAPASGEDAGRYQSPEWWGEWSAEQLTSGVVVTSPLLRVDAAFTNVGVYYAVGNRLVVTSSGNGKVSVATGAWANDGQFGYNDTALTDVAITSPAANPRIDRVIIRKNYTGNTYTPTNAASELVGPYTARITIVSGAEAGSPVAPGLIQDTARNVSGVFGTDGTWDIPLAQYEISTGGVISSLTDEREWVDAETKRLWIPPARTYNTTDGTAPLTISQNYGVEMLDSKICYVGGNCTIPSDFISDATLNYVVSSDSSGNVYVVSWIYYGQCAEDRLTHSIQGAYVAQAITLDLRNCIYPLSLTSASVNDIVDVFLTRDATNPGDTVNDDIVFHGFYLEYLGWRR